MEKFNIHITEYIFLIIKFAFAVCTLIYRKYFLNSI